MSSLSTGSLTAALSLRTALLFAFAIFVLLSLFLLVQHEFAQHHFPHLFPKQWSKLSPRSRGSAIGFGTSANTQNVRFGNGSSWLGTVIDKVVDHLHEDHAEHAEMQQHGDDRVTLPHLQQQQQQQQQEIDPQKERKGQLICNGSSIDSEVIYWKIVPGDDSYESPITPHHGEHGEKFLSFEYDAGGWNNVRMGIECLIVVAHAMGRTLVVPPQQHLYLLGATHQDKDDAKAHDEMGFADFFDLQLLQQHKGFHMLHMQQFLQQQAVTGRLHGQLPPGNSSNLWGKQLWQYLTHVADETPRWQGRFIAFPSRAGDFNLSASLRSNHSTSSRLKSFSGDRKPVYYDQQLQQAKHLHFPGDQGFRILQHHYAFTFFADAEMQSFYRRFVRDYMRYKDEIQCNGHALLLAVREEARSLDSSNRNGDFYALHVRRGDFQFKEVKISAAEIVQNLHFPNGSAMIPPGSVVYLSTDDPDGLCRNCLVQRKPCNTYKSPKPVGCPEDTSWKAFIKAGWKVRLMRDFQRRGLLQNANPNTFGMIESIVCTRATLFAGTYFSTFSGYIHRLRGYHGLGEQTYYHHSKYLMKLQQQQSVGHGWTREWRSGWTDDARGELI